MGGGGIAWFYQPMASGAMPALSLLVPRNEQSSCILCQQLDCSATEREQPLVCVVAARNMGRGVPSFAGMKTRPPAPGASPVLRTVWRFTVRLCPSHHRVVNSSLSIKGPAL